MIVLKKITYIISIIITLTSCVSNKRIAYLQNNVIDQDKISNVYKTVFKPDDLLQITISSDDIESVRPFNLPSVVFSSTTNTAVGQPRLLPYLIDKGGYIDFPILGKLKIGGLTRQQVIDLLINKLSPGYIKRPNINIRITNFKINILGDVARPGTYTIPNERVTILDALSLAGDLNISGKRENVLVIREEGTFKKEYRIDLRSKKMYTSPVFYLQQNDNIYVEHNYARIQSASSNSNTSLFISITGLIITIATFLTR